jgi:hypothetical protein
MSGVELPELLVRAPRDDVGAARQRSTRGAARRADEDVGVAVAVVVAGARHRRAEELADVRSLEHMQELAGGARVEVNVSRAGVWCADGDVVAAVTVGVARVRDRVPEPVAPRAGEAVELRAGPARVHVRETARTGSRERLAHDRLHGAVAVDVGELAHRPAERAGPVRGLERVQDARRLREGARSAGRRDDHERRGEQNEHEHARGFLLFVHLGSPPVVCPPTLGAGAEPRF